MKKIIILLTSLFFFIGCTTNTPAVKESLCLEYKIHFPDEVVTKYYDFTGNKNNVRAFIRSNRKGTFNELVLYNGIQMSIDQSMSPIEIVEIKNK